MIVPSRLYQYSHLPMALLTKVKEPLSPEKQSNAVYKVLCSCGKVYVVEM